MKSKRTIALCVGLVLLLCLSFPSSAVVVPITSVVAGTDGSPPYMIQSITVGSYTVLVSQLTTGTSTGSAAAGTVIGNADDYDLDTIVIRTPRSDPVWQIKQFGGQELWFDTNGDNPDFFIFEVGMNDSFTMQPILSGGELGQEVAVDIGQWGPTGLHTTVQAGGGQEIGGIAFSIIDLLDPQGNPLALSTPLSGIQITGVALDPASFVVVIPEPATLVLFAIGSLVIRYRSYSS